MRGVNRKIATAATTPMPAITVSAVRQVMTVSRNAVAAGSAIFPMSPEKL